MSVEKTVEAVLGTGPVMTVGGIEFQAHKIKLGEKYLFGPLAQMELKATSGDAKAQHAYAAQIAKILSKRSGQKITPEWVADQDDGEMTNLLLVMAGVRKPPESVGDEVEKDEADAGNPERTSDQS